MSSRTWFRSAASAAALLGALASATTALAQTQLAGSPFPQSTLRPSPTSPPLPRAAPPAAPIVDDPQPAPMFAAGPDGPQRVIRIGTGAAATQTISIPKGKSATVELPIDAGDVMVADPTVADVVLTTPRRIQVVGVASGQTDASFLDGMGRRVLHLDIRVDQDSSAAAETIAKLLPGAHIQVTAANGSLILSGQAASAIEADQAMRLAGTFLADPKKVVNLISVAGSEQVMLKVRIVEVNRTVLKQLGFNLSAIIGQLGGPQYSIGKQITFGVAGSLLGGLTGGYSLDTTQQPVITRPTLVPSGIDPTTGQTLYSSQNLQYVDRNDPLSVSQKTAGSTHFNQANAMVEAFERVGLVRTLAEPNLTAVSGEAGHFLVGGEFPVPTSEDVTGRVTVEFKPYGVGLGYTPVVLSNGRISLKISTEVSEISSTGSFSLGTSVSSTSGVSQTGPSLVVPGLTVRRAETTVELPSGGAMMIAGLLQSQTKQTLDSLPGLMQLPVIGSLLRSRDFENDETELVIIVTPYVVKPGRPEDFKTPADGLVIANDLETNLLGRLNSGFGKKPDATAGKTYQGPYGYVVD